VLRIGVSVWHQRRTPAGTRQQASVELGRAQLYKSLYTCCAAIADSTNGSATVLRPSVICLSIVCNVFIVATWCLLPKICLKKQIGSGLWGIEWSHDR